MIMENKQTNKIKYPKTISEEALKEKGRNFVQSLVAFGKLSIPYLIDVQRTREKKSAFLHTNANSTSTFRKNRRV